LLKLDGDLTYPVVVVFCRERKEAKKLGTKAAKITKSHSTSSFSSSPIFSYKWYHSAADLVGRLLFAPNNRLFVSVKNKLSQSST
jgi:hypothetical protein